MSRTVRIDLAYDGAGFHGWQVQPGLRTVQGVLAEGLERLLGRPAKPTGAGRTDTGVHALGQVAHVSDLDAAEVERVMRALPGMAPEDVAITGVREVSPCFDARFSARWRRYVYRFGFAADLFRRGQEWQLEPGLDREAMDAAAARLVRADDFASFCKTASRQESNRCDVTLCRFTWTGLSATLEIRADRFLHHMVRTAVGTLVEVGRGRRVPADLDVVLAARDRRAAGAMAPAHGLYLAEVGYASELDDPNHTAPDPDPGG